MTHFEELESMNKEIDMRPLRRLDLTVREVDGEALVLDRAAGKIHQLNETASYVWSCCDGFSTVVEIAQRYASRYGIAHKLALKDVTAAVSSFQSFGLVSNARRPHDNEEN